MGAILTKHPVIKGHRVIKAFKNNESLRQKLIHTKFDSQINHPYFIPTPLDIQLIQLLTDLAGDESPDNFYTM
jgi:hypothetical protein